MARDDYNPKMDTGIGGENCSPASPGCGWGCAGCLGLVALVVVAFLIFSVTRDSSGDEARDRAVFARIACENAVKNSLKAPSTAKFAGTQSSGSGATYRVVGAVDAENSFGAALRNNFECSVSFSGDRTTATVTSLG